VVGAEDELLAGGQQPAASGGLALRAQVGPQRRAVLRPAPGDAGLLLLGLVQGGELRLEAVHLAEEAFDLPVVFAVDGLGQAVGVLALDRVGLAVEFLELGPGLGGGHAHAVGSVWSVRTPARRSRRRASSRRRRRSPRAAARGDSSGAASA